MHRILISGYYGFKNLGDEAILEAIVKNLNRNINNVEITVLSADPKITSEKYGVKSINRKNVFKIIKAMANTDILLSGGGSLLQDITSKKSINYYLGIIAIGLIMRKKVMVYSQGIGPINKEFHKWLTKFLLNKVNYITVRDYNSKKDLVEMGVNSKKIQVTADPVMSMDRIDKESGLRILQTYDSSFDPMKPTIGFAFRGKNYTPKIKRILIETVEKLNKELNANIVFIPFHYSEDMEINNDLCKVLGNKVIFLKYRYNSKEILSIFENLDLLVGVRLHSLIFAAVANVPMIGISYDPKIDYFMDTLNKESLCDIDNLSSRILIEGIYEILNNNESYKECLKNKVIELRNKISINAEIVKKLL